MTINYRGWSGKQPSNKERIERKRVTDKFVTASAPAFKQLILKSVSMDEMIEADKIWNDLLENCGSTPFNRGPQFCPSRESRTPCNPLKFHDSIFRGKDVFHTYNEEHS